MNKSILRTILGYIIALLLSIPAMGFCITIHSIVFHADALFSLDAAEYITSLAMENWQAKLWRYAFFLIIPAIFVGIGLKVAPQSQRRRLWLVSAAIYFVFPFFTFNGIGWENLATLLSAAGVGWFMLSKKSQHVKNA
jgi:hypothetical protein